jgi:hypothetical protein
VSLNSIDGAKIRRQESPIRLLNAYSRLRVGCNYLKTFTNGYLIHF